MNPDFSIQLTDDEKAAFLELAARFSPDMKRGAKAALFRHWLYTEAERAGILIQHKTRYGGSRQPSDKKGSDS